jgi:pheromone a factor receptor
MLIRNTVYTVVAPWKGWADTHADFSRVDQIPAIVWRAIPGMEPTFELSRWLTVFCAFMFFFFFGFAEEARKNYHTVVQSFAKRVGLPTTGYFGSSFFNSSGYVCIS